MFYEYVYDTAVKARERGLRSVLVTAAYIEAEPLQELCKVVDAAHVDLKSFSETFYRRVSGAALKPVLRSLEIMRQAGIWVEIIHLMVPGLSDSLNELRQMCRWIAQNLGADVPLHLSRFYPAYKLSMLPPTPISTLIAAEEIAKAEGLHFVYVGNVPERPQQDTVCPNCGQAVIRRAGYRVLANSLQDGRCPCGAPIAGVWS